MIQQDISIHSRVHTHVRNGSAQLLIAVVLGILALLVVAIILIPKILPRTTPPASPTTATTDNLESGNATETTEASGDHGSTTTQADYQEIDDAIAAINDYINTDRLPQAIKIAEALYDKYPAELRVLSVFYELRMFEERFEDAYILLQQLLAIENDNPEYHFNAGILASMLQNYQAAAMHFQDASNRDISDPKFPLYHAQILIKLHEYTEARIKLLAVIKLDGEIHQAYGTLAEIALIENALDMADQHIKRAQTLAPTFLKWKLVEAKIIRRRGKPEDALIRLNALQPPYRHAQEVVDEVAQCWAMSGSPTRAAREHIDHINRNPENWQSAAAAGRFLLLADNTAEATDWYDYAHRIKPDAEEVRRLGSMLEAADGIGG